MAEEIQGSDVAFYVSTTENGTYKQLVCEEDSQFDISAEVTTTKTKCGPFKSVDDPDFSASGNAVANATPEAGELSYEDVVAYQKAKQKLWFKYYNATSATVNEGEGVFFQGQGYFTQTTLTAPGTDVVKFSWTFEGVGTLDNEDS